jgi:hypothetical protein
MSGSLIEPVWSAQLLLLLCNFSDHFSGYSEQKPGQKRTFLFSSLPAVSSHLVGLNYLRWFIPEHEIRTVSNKKSLNLNLATVTFLC